MHYSGNVVITVAAIRQEAEASAARESHDDIVAAITDRSIDPWTAAVRVVATG